MIFENTQEPIIEESVFLIVQKIRQGRRRPTKMGDMGMFSGLLFCADCGGKMYLCSAFPKDTLAEMIAAQEKKHTELEALYEEASAELERNAELMANVSQLYEELISYADLYDSASFEAKKMIVSQLIRRVDVYRGYQIHVDFNFDLAQYLENSDELAC